MRRLRPWLIFALFAAAAFFLFRAWPEAYRTQ